MPQETDAQIAARKIRERAVKTAWRNWRQSPHVKAIVSHLPPANPAPKSILVTRNRHTDPEAAGFRRGSPT